MIEMVFHNFAWGVHEATAPDPKDENVIRKMKILMVQDQQSGMRFSLPFSEEDAKSVAEGLGTDSRITIADAMPNTPPPGVS